MKTIPLPTPLVALITGGFLAMAFGASAQTFYCVGGTPVHFEDFGNGPYAGPANPDVTVFTYNGNTPLGANGTYTVAHAPAESRPDAWHGGEDHTSGDIDGYCLVVNGDSGTEIYRKTIISIDTTHDFRLGIWAANSIDTSLFAIYSDANIEMRIEDMGGSLIASAFTGPIGITPSLEWSDYYLTFSPGPNTEIQIVLVDNGAPGTNDYVIDDIELLECPLPPPIPAMQDWALLIFGLLLANLALVAMYRQGVYAWQGSN